LAKRALVLSGGGMFGAWQAGIWNALSLRFQPDLVVGASVGALNGYAIATGWPPAELCEFWQKSDAIGFDHLENAAKLLTSRPLQINYATVVVDLFRMKPVTYRDQAVTAEHLIASCAVPGVVAPRKIDGRWLLDGGLLNPLPVWVAVELGATEIVALNALPDIPSIVLKPFVQAFRGIFGHHPALPSYVALASVKPGRELGSLTDAVFWDRDNIARWLEQGKQEAENISLPKCIER
jgi:NTE family protein